MAVYQLPTGLTHRSAAFAYRGGSFTDARDFTMTAALVVHPRGDILIDTGFGARIRQHMDLMPWWFRLTTRFEVRDTAATQLSRAGYATNRLSRILLTHAHWDHASGAGDFLQTPVWIPRAEHAFVREGGWITSVAREIDDARIHEYDFPDGPYLGFPRSFDLYDDGSIVIVEAKGHTPGSVIVFVTVSTGARYAFVGDLAWQREGISRREERPWLQRTLGDSNIDETRSCLTHVSLIAERFPTIRMIPAHDSRAFDGLPRLHE